MVVLVICHVREVGHVLLRVCRVHIRIGRVLMIVVGLVLVVGRLAQAEVGALLYGRVLVEGLLSADEGGGGTSPSPPGLTQWYDRLALAH